MANERDNFSQLTPTEKGAIRALREAIDLKFSRLEISIREGKISHATIEKSLDKSLFN